MTNSRSTASVYLLKLTKHGDDICVSCLFESNEIRRKIVGFSNYFISKTLEIFASLITNTTTTKYKNQNQGRRLPSFFNQQ